MNIIETNIEDLFIIEPVVFEDSRGSFFEVYNEKIFKKLGLKYEFVQDNQSFSYFGVIRGLHYQLEPQAQAKLVRAVEGTILDVAVDLREDSDTFGQYFAVELSDKNYRMLMIPRGFAHGFSVLSEKAIVHYKCDNLYNKEAERGIIYNDPKLNIDWKIPLTQQLLSTKDMDYPTFDEAEKFD